MIELWLGFFLGFLVTYLILCMPFTKFICTECGHSDEPCKHWRQGLEESVLTQMQAEHRDCCKFLRSAVLEIIHLLNRQTGFSVVQLEGEDSMPITGIVAGATGVFKETPLPLGAVIPAGTIPVWTSSDPTNAPAVASADGTTCSVAVPATATITSFDLSVQNQDGSFPTKVTVPVTPAAPPAQTGFQIDQVS